MNSSARNAKSFIVDFCPTPGGGQPVLQFRCGPVPVPSKAYNCPPKVPIPEPASKRKVCNVMSDPRVRRGAYIIDPGSQISESPFYPCFEMIKKDPVCQLYLRSLKKYNRTSGPSYPEREAKPKKTMTKTDLKRTKKAVLKQSSGKVLPGRQHAACQSDDFYELILDELETITTEIQTDPMSQVDFSLVKGKFTKPEKIGDDKETQTIPGELYNFAEEVEPIVTNCVTSTIAQALLELMMENELESLLVQQREYEETRHQELMKLRRLHERKKTLVEEHWKRLMEEKEIMESAKRASEVVNLALYTKFYLSDILADALQAARKDGMHNVVEEASTGNVLSIMTGVKNKLRKYHILGLISRSLLDDIIQNVASERMKSWIGSNLEIGFI